VYGNPIAFEEVGVAVSEGVSLEEDQGLMATAVGEYSIAATQEGLSAEASWTVVAAEPAAVDFAIEETVGLEAGDDTDYEVIVTDAYGNLCSVETFVECDDDSIDIDDDELEFSTDGVFTCWASVAESDLMDEKTIIVDGAGPGLAVLTPERGSWTILEAVEVSGTVSDAVTDVSSLTVNGDDVDFSGGTFNHPLALVAGLNVIETVALDSDVDEEGEANRSSDVRTVLQAPYFADPDAYLANGLIVRMEDDAGGLGLLEEMGSELITAADLGAEVLGEIFESETCVGVGWACVDVSATGYLDSISLGDINLDIDPMADGTISVRVDLNTIDADWSVVVSPGPDVSGDIHADTVRADVVLDPYFSDGELSVSTVSVTITAIGFDVEVSGAWDEIAGWVGVDVEDLVWDILRDAIDEEVREKVPALIEDTFADLELSQDIEVADNSYTLSAMIGGLVVDNDGIDILLGTTLNPEEVLGAGVEDGPSGLPVYSYATPDWAFATGTTLALSGDFLNQILYGFWRGGLLDQELTDADLGLEMDTISLLMPGLTELTMVTTPLLPPVLMPRDDPEDGADFELYLGDMAVQLYNGVISEESLYMELYVTAVAPVDLGAGSGGAEVTLSLGEPTVMVDVSYTDEAYTVTTESTEALFEDLMPLYLPEITGAVGSIPLPEFEGFTLSGLSTDMIGTDDPPGYWSISGSLE
jgi:hypothetical protein